MSAEFITGLATLIAVIISLRSTSYTELKGLYDSIRNDFDNFKEASKKREDAYEVEIKSLKDEGQRKDGRIEKLQEEMEAQVRQNDNFKRYIARLINQLEKAQIVPEKMPGDSD